MMPTATKVGETPGVRGKTEKPTLYIYIDIIDIYCIREYLYVLLQLNV